MYHNSDLILSDSLAKSLDLRIGNLIQNNADINETWSDFSDDFDQIVHACVPTKTVVTNPNQPKWMDEKTKKLLLKKRKIYRKYKNTNLSVYSREYKDICKESKKAVKKRKAVYLRDKLFVPLSEGNSRPFYSYLRGKTFK